MGFEFRLNLEIKVDFDLDEVEFDLVVSIDLQDKVEVKVEYDVDQHGWDCVKCFENHKNKIARSCGC